MAGPIAPPERPRYRLGPPSTAPTVPERLLARTDPTPLAVCLLGSILCLAVGLIHIQDQGGFLGDQSPTWIAVSYYVVEIVAGIAALLLARQHLLGWVLGVGVSAGPATAYILSRTIGLPGDSGDIGNWGYTLGTVSLVVEGLLLLLSVTALARAAASWRSENEVTRVVALTAGQQTA
jgi:hypothetical protein